MKKWGDCALWSRALLYDKFMHQLLFPMRISEVEASTGYGQELFKCPVLLLSLAGTGTLNVNGHVHELPSGTAVLTSPIEPPVLVYKNHRKEKWHLLEVLFCSGNPLLIPALNCRYGMVLRPRDPEALAAFLRSFRLPGGSVPIMESIEGLCIASEIFRGVLKGLPEVGSTSNTLAQNVRLAVDMNLSAASVADIAQENNVSPAHLERLFKAEFDCTLYNYIRKVRMQQAESMLRNTSLSCKEIASRLGFSHLSSFYRAFKQVTGMTAGSVRGPEPEH